MSSIYFSRPRPTIYNESNHIVPLIREGNILERQEYPCSSLWYKSRAPRSRPSFAYIETTVCHAVYNTMRPAQSRFRCRPCRTAGIMLVRIGHQIVAPMITSGRSSSPIALGRSCDVIRTTRTTIANIGRRRFMG